MGMGAELIAQRYARALVRHTGTDLSQCREVFDCFEVLEELFSFPEAMKTLASPVMPQGLKEEILDYALQQTAAGPLLRSFVMTVLEQGRVRILPQIGMAFYSLVLEANGKQIAVVSSASTLGAEESELIAATLSGLMHKKVEVESVVDESLLGGFIIRIGHTVLDLSLRSKLDELTSNVAL